MSLTSSLYTGTSGLTNMGNSMQVIGDNISNVNTVGFKGNRSLFSDLLNQSIATQSGSSQVGRGTAIQVVDSSFAQGSFESTGNTTDLSIGGNGFFQVRDKNSEQLYYTRAGNFSFDKDGKLVNPDGYVVQGWKLDDETGEDMGAITDIVLESFTSPPKKTSKINMVTNLNVDATSKSKVLANAWGKGDEDTDISANTYSYPSVVKVFDSLGSTHDVTVYYDKKEGSTWEYIITCNPSEDSRNLVQGTNGKGLLARGTIEFNESDGSVIDMTMEQFTGRIGNVRSFGVNDEDEITFRVFNNDSVAKDGFDFNVEYDGNQWQFKDSSGPAGVPDGIIDAHDKPANYPNAEIMTTSNEKKIDIRFDPDPTDPSPEADMTIYLDNDATATDSLLFDINKTNNIHVQEATNITYEGDTKKKNTEIFMNDPSVMIRDVENLNLIWDKMNESWYMSYPTAEGIVDNNTGVLEIDLAGVPTPLNAVNSITVNDPDNLKYKTGNLNVTWSGTNWYWDTPMKFHGGTGEITSVPTLTYNDPTVFTKATGENKYGLSYDGSGNWSFSNIDEIKNDYPSAQILTATSDENQVQIDFDGNGTADITYAFAAPLDTTGVTPSTMTISADPFPAGEYPGAEITSVDASNFSIAFDGGSTADMTFSLNDGAVAVAANANDTVTFVVDPRGNPEEYPDAAVKGDKDSVYVDLDGSGGEDDTKDILFTFTDPLGTGLDAKNSSITFDIVGGTSWEKVDKADIATEGYYSFMADFLFSIGEFGSSGEFETTEQDIQFDIGVLFDGVSFQKSSVTTTQYAKPSSTVFKSADGYGAGDLEGVSVSGDGTITGVYSNGEQIPLYRVALAKFLNNQGLYKEGGNLYRETRNSGDAITGRPGENGLGDLSPNSLEMSNVDIAAEFVNMITTQRGFQANSKIVTTVDDMLSEVINMKR